MFKIGDILQGRYQILQEIGAGGIGVIFLAEDLNLRKRVVVKKIKENFVDNLATRSEVDILKNLRHTYLPQVYDFFQDGNEVYTVMDYIEGYDLQVYLMQQIEIPETEILKWLWQLLEVLKYLHSQNPPIYHCDIKPANIMITTGGDVCLIDFNISLGDDEKTLKGLSKWYSAPEQREAAQHPGKGPKLDERMDIYSLGASFYSLMTGYYPETDQESIWTQESAERYSDGLIQVIRKSMTWDRRGRFANAAAMQKALEHLNKWDSAERKIFHLRLGVYAAAAVLATCGVSMMIYGGQLRNEEVWKQKMREFRTLCEERDETEIIESAMQLLNSSEAKRYMTQEERGNILWQVGEAYYLMEDYSEAADWYLDAAECLPGDLQVYMDCAVTLIRDDQDDAANALIAQARKNGIQSEAFLLVEGEMLLKQGEYEKAKEKAELVIGSSYDSELQFRSCILAADACLEMNRQTEALEWLQKADKWQTDRSIMRRIMKLSAELSAAYPGELYGELAITYGTEICDKWPLSETDQYNLISVLIDEGRITEASKRVEILEREGTGTYQVSMYRAYLAYRLEGQKSRSERDYSDFLAYCAQAEQEYERVRKVSTDDQMESLLELYALMQKRR